MNRPLLRARLFTSILPLSLVGASVAVAGILGVGCQDSGDAPEADGAGCPQLTAPCASGVPYCSEVTGTFTQLESGYTYLAATPDFTSSAESPLYPSTQCPPAGAPIPLGQTVPVQITRPDGSVCKIDVATVAQAEMEPVELVQQNAYGRPELYPGEGLTVGFDPPEDPNGRPWTVSATVDGEPVDGVAGVEGAHMGAGTHEIAYTLGDARGRTRTLQATRLYRGVALYRDTEVPQLSFGCEDTAAGAVLSMQGGMSSSRWQELFWANVRLAYQRGDGSSPIDFGVGETSLHLSSPGDVEPGAPLSTIFTWQSPVLRVFEEGGDADPTLWDTWAPVTCKKLQGGLTASIYGGFLLSEHSAMFETLDIQIRPDGHGGWIIGLPDPTTATPPPPSVPVGGATTTKPGCNCQLDHLSVPGKPGLDNGFAAYVTATEFAQGYAASTTSESHAAASHTTIPEKHTFTITCSPQSCDECCPHPTIKLEGELAVGDAKAQVSALDSASAWVTMENTQEGVINATLANGTAAGAKDYTYSKGYKIGGKASGKVGSKAAEGGAEVSGDYSSSSKYSGGAQKNNPSAGDTKSTEGSVNACTATQQIKSRGVVGAQGEWHFFKSNDEASASLLTGSNAITGWTFTCN